MKEVEGSGLGEQQSGEMEKHGGEEEERRRKHERRYRPSTEDTSNDTVPQPKVKNIDLTGALTVTKKL